MNDAAWPRKLAGSFRDPDGFVFEWQGRICRAVSPAAEAAQQVWASSGLRAKMVDAGQVVGGRPLSDPALPADFHGCPHFYEHERIAHWVWPAEWCVSMLADAAVLTLDIVEQLSSARLSLKDATAYNVQFRRGRPVFVDWSSVEKPKRMDVWYALGQFQRHFLYPLLLVRERGWDLSSYFIANLDGRGVSDTAKAFRGVAGWAPGKLLDVTLPAMMERRADRGGQQSASALRDRPDRGPAGLLANLSRLRSKIRGLAKNYRTSGAWHHYTATCNYDDAAERSKKTIIAGFLGEHRPATVLDLGCNTGDYSYLAAEHGAEVIAADADHDAIELLWRRLREKPAAITPMVANLANPTPAIGFMNRERASFLERAASECVMALALIHHLLISANIPPQGISALFAAVAKRHLVLEFVPPDDPQFQRLVRFRENYYAGLTIESLLDTMSADFRLLSRQPVANSPRTLLLLERRNA